MSENQTSHYCPVCQALLHVSLPAVYAEETGQTFSLWRCPACDLVQTLPQPDDLTPYYSKRYYGNRHGRLKRFRFRQRRKQVSALFPARTDTPALLDIGCGDGAFLEEMAGAGWKVMGTELSPDQALLDSGRVKERIEEVYPHAPFDCITLWHSLEHMPDIGMVLRHIHALLAPQGRVIIAVPNLHSLQARLFKDAWLALDVPRHLFHFSVPSLKHALESEGFRVTRFVYQEFEYDLMGWVQSSLNRLFRHTNVFFDLTRGQPSTLSRPVTLVHLLTGIFLIPILIPAVLMEWWLKQSGTFIMTAAGMTSNPEYAHES